MISVINHITPNYPSTIFMTCTGDFLKNEAPKMHQTLLHHDVPHAFIFYGDKDHELGHVFHLNMKVEQAHDCNRQECGFFKRFI